MNDIYNKKTKRYNSVRTAIKNGILENPNDFKMTDGAVLVKTGRGYEVTTVQKAGKYIKKQSDILPVNKTLMLNPKSKKLILKNAKNIKMVKQYEADARKVRVTTYAKKTYEDRILGFTSIKYEVNVNNLREFYENIKNRVNKVGKIVNVTLYFKHRVTGDLEYATARMEYLTSYEEFKNHVINTETKCVAGSDRLSTDDYRLLIDVYSIIYKEVGKAKGKADKILFECHNCENKGRCWEKVFEIIYNGDSDKLKSRMKADKASEFEEFRAICEILDVNLIGNTFTLKNKRNMELFDNREIIKTDTLVVGKNMMTKMVKLEDSDIDVYYFHRNTESDIYVIYDEIGAHYDVCKGKPTLDNIYFSMSGYVYKKAGDKYNYIYSVGNLNKMCHAYKYDAYYVFFDYETVIDYSVKGCALEYSISYFIVNQSDLDLLEKYDYDKNNDEVQKIIKDKVFNIVGYDCTTKFINWIIESQTGLLYNNKLSESVKFTFVSFNGSNFDNIILLRGLIEYSIKNKSEIAIDDIFYNGNQLLNFSVNKRHFTFDVAKHLSGSLKFNCESFKVNCVSKGSFDHYEAQTLHDSGKLIEHMKKSTELVEYNNNDVLSLAVIFQRYKMALDKSSYTKKISAELTEYKTIGSVIWNVARQYWKTFNVVQQEKYGKKQKMREVTKPVHFPELEFEIYKDILRYKSAGRVQMFNGIKEIFDVVCSLDICSMYPFVMAVLYGAWYPCGEIIKTDEYVKNKIGFYYCTIDQSNLKKCNLPNIVAEKVYAKKADGTNGELIENDWASENILIDYCLSTVVIEQLLKYGCKVEIKRGIYFTDAVKGCDLFKFILDFMKMKNEQDSYKAQKSTLYNEALRQTIKLLVNSMSGKVIEGLHTEKTERVTPSRFDELLKDENVTEISCVNIIGNRVFTTYSVSEESKLKDQRPIYLGVLIYNYSQNYIYDTLFSKIGLDKLLYTDTDSCKFLSSVLENPSVKKALEECVPYWDEVLEYDARFKNFKLFSDDKVFGSYEDELNELKPNYFTCLQKKFWIAINTEKYKNIQDEINEKHTELIKDMKNNLIEITDVDKIKELKEKFAKDCRNIRDEYSGKIAKTYKMSCKGVRDTAIILNGNEEYITTIEKTNKKGVTKITYVINDIKKANSVINESMNQIIYKLPEFCDKLNKERNILVLTYNFRRVIKNTLKNVKTDQAEKFNKLHNTIQFSPVIKKIRI